MVTEGGRLADVYSNGEKNPERFTWKGAIDCVEPGFNPNQNFAEYITARVTNPDHFLGLGGAGMVFALDHSVCVKMVDNRHAAPDAAKYDLGNTAKQEAEIQNRMRGVVVDGVFAPHVVGYYSGQESCAILMEQLDAMNLQMILNNQENLPADFDIECFIDGLYGYVDTMHERGVVHCDLEPRNVMIDRATGTARVIDFGRAKVMDDPKDEATARAKQGDLQSIDTIYQQLENFLS